MSASSKILSITILTLMIISGIAKADPYQYESNVPMGFVGIYDVSDLLAINDNANTLNGDYILMNNINMGGVTFTPIGITSPFTGTFDGNNRQISNFVINNAGASNIGFFGTSSGIIYDLGLSSFQVMGLNNIGGMIGTMIGGSISRCYVDSVQITSTGSIVGGFVGLMNPTVGLGGAIIQDSKASGTVHTSRTSTLTVSGFCGAMTAPNVVASASITNSYTLVTTISGGSPAAGTVGYGFALASGYSTITNCYAGPSTFSGLAVAHGFGSGGTMQGCYYVPGYATSDKGTPLTVSNSKDQNSYANWDFANTWKIQAGTPILIWEIIIKTAPNSGNVGSEYSYAPNWAILNSGSITMTVNGPSVDWLGYGISNKTIFGTPTLEGEYLAAIYNNGIIQYIWKITIGPSLAPIMSEDTAAPTTATGPYSYTPEIAGIWEILDGTENITVLINGGEGWLSYDPENKTFTGTPTDSGTYEIAIYNDGVLVIYWAIEATLPTGPSFNINDYPDLMLAAAGLAILLLAIGAYMRHPLIAALGVIMAIIAAGAWYFDGSEASAGFEALIDYLNDLWQSRGGELL